MELNATLLVQIAHFVCAYIIVDRVLLCPALARVQADERRTNTIERDVAEGQQRINERARYNEQDWLILQKRLRAECPESVIGKHREVVVEPTEYLPYDRAGGIYSDTVRDTAEQGKKVLFRAFVAQCQPFIKPGKERND